MKKLAVLLLMVPTMAFGKIKTETIDYKDGDKVLEGMIAYDDKVTTPKPAVIVVHEWMGLDDYAKKRAEQVAALGYVAFAANIYGKGVHLTDKAEAGKTAGAYKNDRALMRSRIKAAYDALAKDKHVDPTKIAVMGYCFGGTVALELARSGAPLKGTVSFHGGLSNPKPQDAKNIKGRVLVLHGGSDGSVKPEEMNQFVSEMNDANVNWDMVTYGPAVHGFTNPKNGSDKTKGLAYNKYADERSWDEMKRFFSEIF
jgi:dienelactone hydrolase